MFFGFLLFFLSCCDLCFYHYIFLKMTLSKRVTHPNLQLSSCLLSFTELIVSNSFCLELIFMYEKKFVTNGPDVLMKPRAS